MPRSEAAAAPELGVLLRLEARTERQEFSVGAGTLGRSRDMREKRWVL